MVVNGRQLIGASHLLNDGDVVEAGSGRFVFTDGEPKLDPIVPRTDVAKTAKSSEHLRAAP